MATIKLQPSGAVVLKDGKVACACCEVGCCMYNAATVGEVVAGNLPTTLRLRNAENTGYISLSVNGTSYGDTINGVIFESNRWAIYRSGIKTTRSCLFTEGDYNSNAGIVKDNFPSVLYTDPFYGFSGVIPRVELCGWYSEEQSYYGLPLAQIIYGFHDLPCELSSGFGPSWWFGNWIFSALDKVGGGGTPLGRYEIDYSINECDGFDFSLSVYE
jgi:hypothetical protein